MLGVRHTTKADPLAVIVVAECQYQRLGFPIAMRARNVGHVMRMALFLFFQRQLAIVAKYRVGFLQRRVNADPTIKDEAFALKVRAAAFFEVLQNPTV